MRELEARGQQAVQRLRVIDQAAEHHRDDEANRAPAHGGGEQPVPRVRPPAFRQGIVGQRLIRAADAGFG